MVNPMVNHCVSPSKPHLASALVLAGFGLRCSRPGLLRGLRSPFAELLGWDVRMYVDPTSHFFSRRSPAPPIGSTIHTWGECMGPGTHGRATDQSAELRDQEVAQNMVRLNAAAVYYGCAVEDGMSPYRFIMGKAYVVGRHRDTGEPMTSNVLWGILNFIYEAMDVYADEKEGGSSSRAGPARGVWDGWADDYRIGIWSPRAGTGGVDIYECDPHQCMVARAPWIQGGAVAVDHGEEAHA